MSELQMLGNIKRGYYSFLDYAIAYWPYHLEMSLASTISDDTLQDIADIADSFVRLHWIDQSSLPQVPPSLQDRFKYLEPFMSTKRLLSATILAKRQLHSYGKTLSDEEQVLDLFNLLKRIRLTIENLVRSTEFTYQGRDLVSVASIIQQFHGKAVFKCPRINCVHFYVGFQDGKARDEHIAKHERSFFCSFPSCQIAVIGCETSQDLKKHEAEYHGIIDNESFPDVAVDKVSFNCPHCDRQYTRKQNLQLHIRVHERAQAEKFVCKVCGELFKRQNDKTRHEATQHSGKKYVCGVCSRAFNRPDGLIRHFKSQMGQECARMLEKNPVLESDH
jgi:uncharacterized C2H2 Zn-finger protein